MYHPGKVIDIFHNNDKNIHAVDSTVQAMLEMWDENLITVLVDPVLNTKVSKDDVVLVDYRPFENKAVPKMIVTKILKGSKAKQTWKIYKDQYKKMKKPQSMPRIESRQPYVG
jgi:hypothetical protein